MIKTTKEHFELFKEECQKWAKRLLLEGKRYDFEHIKLDCRADCLFDVINQVINIRLSTKIDTNSEKELIKILKNTAKHEMLEALIGELRVIASSAYKTNDEVTAANHRLIRKLEKIIQ